MRLLLVGVLTTFLSVTAFARGGSSSGVTGAGDFSFMGYYGLNSLSPGDLNTYASQQSPVANSLSTGTIVGGGIGWNIPNSRWGIDVQYESITASNFKTVNGGNYGWNVQQNNINVGLDYMIVDAPAYEFRMGAAAVIPTYSHVTFMQPSGNLDYNTANTIGGYFNVGLGFHVMHRFSLFVEGRYMYMHALSPTNAAGATLQVNGTAAAVDLSGVGGVAGLELFL